MITEIKSGYVAAIAQELPIKPDYHIVQNAGHFAFLSPCSLDLATDLPKICKDRSDFDRVAFHQEFDADVLAFFRKHLVAAHLP